MQGLRGTTGSCRQSAERSGLSAGLTGSSACVGVHLVAIWVAVLRGCIERGCCLVCATSSRASEQ